MPNIQINTAVYTELGQSLESVQKALNDIRDSVSASVKKLNFIESALTLYDNKVRAAIAKIPDQAERCGRAASWLFFTAERYNETERLIKQSVGMPADVFFTLSNSNPIIEKVLNEYHASVEELYEDVLEDREKNAVDENTKKLYQKYKSKIKINSDDYDETAHYQPLKNHINYNLEEDYENERGAGSTYYHEVGHLVDDRSDCFGNTSTDARYDFYESLNKDLDSWIKNRMREKGYTDIQDAYDDLSEWLWTDPDHKSGVSDIVKGLTNGQARGRWGHDSDYYNDSSIAKEAFAHFFEAGMCSDSSKIDYIKELFPSAYNEYQKMVADELNR